MNIRIISCCHTTALLAATLLAAQDAAAFGTLDDLQNNPLSSEFRALDRNRSASLSREEAGRDSDIAGRFDRADRNRDGKLTEQEYVDTKSSLQQARVQSFLDDSTVTARVKSELLRDSGIGGLSISVETHRGHVILSGFVDNEGQIHRASEIASGVRGVIRVKNSLLLRG